MLQATWCPDAHVFLWDTQEATGTAIKAMLPELRLDGGVPARCALWTPTAREDGTEILGYSFPVREVISPLASLPRGRPVGDSLHALSLATLLALELASQRLVLPRALDTRAQWAAVWTRPVDLHRLHALTAALPLATYAAPPASRPSPEVALRTWIDAVIDQVYRQGAHPAPNRGWVHALGAALRGPEDVFAPRDPAALGGMERITAWSDQGSAEQPLLGLRLGLPARAEAPFVLEPFALSADRAHRVSLEVAWSAGSAIDLGGTLHASPARALLSQFTRAGWIFAPLRQALAGSTPQRLEWPAQQAWTFLTEAVRPLRNAGIAVDLPESLEERGTRRLQARLRLHVKGERPDWSEPQACTWEVTLGGASLSEDDLSALLSKGSPLVFHKGEWLFLDPKELEHVRQGGPRTTEIPGPVALGAVLTGSYQGIPVVADHRLDAILKAIRSPIPIELPATFCGDLRPYQREGVAWLQTLGSVGLGAALADDMGLGKTIQAIAALTIRAGRGPALVVCPASVLGNWQHELATFAPTLRVVRHHGLARESAAWENADVVLTTYALMVRDVDALSALTWDTLILDEAQSIKNVDSKRAEVVRQIRGRHRIALTGTPVENRLDELWAIFDFLIPGLLGSRRDFQRELAIPIERFGDDEAASRLRTTVGPFMLRREKTDPRVISDLPEKREGALFCELSPEQERLYRSISEEALEEIESGPRKKRAQLVLTMLTDLKQVCNHPAQFLEDARHAPQRSGKMVRTLDLLDEIHESGEKAILFTQYVKMGEILQDVLSKHFQAPVSFLQGSTPLPVRDEMVARFQTGREPSPVLLISLRAGGTGLNLTRATRVIHYDRWWNPAVEDQATDRAYRIGQTSAVEVHKLVTLGTLEERIAALLDSKRSLAERVMGGGEQWLSDLDDDALRRLVSLSAAMNQENRA